MSNPLPDMEKPDGLTIIGNAADVGVAPGNEQVEPYEVNTAFVPGNTNAAAIMIGEKASQNRYQVTDEFSYTNGLHTNRYDVVFLISGIPLFFVETKAVAKFFRRSVRSCPVKKIHSQPDRRQWIFCYL